MKRATGFTLVEILVVVIIIAVIISMTVLSIGTTGKDAQLDQESRRLEGLLGMLHDRAVLEGRDFGLRIEPAAYEFLAYDVIRDRWQRLDQDREFRHRTLPKGLSFQLQLDSQNVVIKPPDSDLKTDALPTPQVAIAASGDGTPFRLTLQRDGTQAKAIVDGDAMGKVSRKNSDQAGKAS